MNQNESSDLTLELKNINMSWDQLITDEEELVEAGFPQALLKQWIAKDMITAYFPNGNLQHFYTDDILDAAMYQLKIQQHDKKQSYLDAYGS